MLPITIELTVVDHPAALILTFDRLVKGRTLAYNLNHHVVLTVAGQYIGMIFAHTLSFSALLSVKGNVCNIVCIEVTTLMLFFYEAPISNPHIEAYT